MNAYTYDGMYRVLTEIRTDTGKDADTVTSAYNAAGDRVSVTNPGKSVGYAYDVAGRLLRVSENGKTTSYTYDKNSNKITETKPNGLTQNWTYDVSSPTLLSYSQPNYISQKAGQKCPVFHFINNFGENFRFGVSGCRSA